MAREVLEGIDVTQHGHYVSQLAEKMKLLAGKLVLVRKQQPERWAPIGEELAAWRGEVKNPTLVEWLDSVLPAEGEGGEEPADGGEGETEGEAPAGQSGEPKEKAGEAAAKAAGDVKVKVRVQVQGGAHITLPAPPSP
jgi:hypothetical protein